MTGVEDAGAGWRPSGNSNVVVWMGVEGGGAVAVAGKLSVAVFEITTSLKIRQAE